MGQNQDKLDGGEQALSEGLEEMRPNSDSGGVGNHTGDVMEGGSFCEEEAGNTGENSREPDTLDGRPSHEPTTPFSEQNINFAVREVRLGGAAGKEGGGGGGGEGGRAAPLAPQETDENQKSSARVEERARSYKLYNQIRREEKRTEEELHTSSKINMEDTVPDEEIQDEDFSAGVSHGKYGHAFTSEDANSLANTEEDPVTVKMSRCGAHSGIEFLPSVQQDQNEAIMADTADGDIKLCAGTVGRLSERKGLPTAQSLHPLINSLQKESLSDMSDTIHCRPPKKRTENNTKQETLTCEVKRVSNDCSPIKPKVTDTVDQRESARPYLQMDTAEATTNQKIDSISATNRASPNEPSSILEKLLKRNREQTTTALSEIKEVDINEKDIVDDTATRISDSAATALSPDKIDQSVINTSSSAPDMKGLNEKLLKESLAAKHHHTKGPDMEQRDTSDTSDALCFQPGVITNTMCDSSLANPHYSTADCESSKNIKSTEVSVKKEMEVKPNVSSSASIQSDVLHERTSCEVSSVIAEESAPSSVSDSKFTSTKNDGQIADSCHLLRTEKTDTSSVRPPLQIKTDQDSKTIQNVSGSTCSDDQSLRRKKVENSTGDTAAKALDAGSVLVQASRTITEESHRVAAGMKQDLHMTLHMENMMPYQSGKKLCKESDDSISEMDKSQGIPKSRPVSELIKETIQLHEKLQHQERPKPTEVKSDEQGQSVKVAQMKAAFDAAQKSPDKTVERKPSVRKGRNKI